MDANLDEPIESKQESTVEESGALARVDPNSFQSLEIAKAFTTDSKINEATKASYEIKLAIAKALEIMGEVVMDLNMKPWFRMRLPNGKSMMWDMQDYGFEKILEAFLMAGQAPPTTKEQRRAAIGKMIVDNWWSASPKYLPNNIDHQVIEATISWLPLIEEYEITAKEGYEGITSHANVNGYHQINFPWPPKPEEMSELLWKPTSQRALADNGIVLKRVRTSAARKWYFTRHRIIRSLRLFVARHPRVIPASDPHFKPKVEVQYQETGINYAFFDAEIEDTRLKLIERAKTAPEAEAKELLERIKMLEPGYDFGV